MKRNHTNAPSKKELRIRRQMVEIETFLEFKEKHPNVKVDFEKEFGNSYTEAKIRVAFKMRDKAQAEEEKFTIVKE